jgi:hypothetical protein
MSRHVTYRGTTMDMDSLRRENEKVTALGNMRVNARGDQIERGEITKTADQIARENHRVQTAVFSTGIKGPMPKSEDLSPVLEKESKPEKVARAKKTREVELPSGDIVVEEEKND